MSGNVIPKDGRQGKKTTDRAFNARRFLGSSPFTYYVEDDTRKRAKKTCLTDWLVVLLYIIGMAVYVSSLVNDYRHRPVILQRESYTMEDVRNGKIYITEDHRYDEKKKDSAPTLGLDDVVFDLTLQLKGAVQANPVQGVTTGVFTDYGPSDYVLASSSSATGSTYKLGEAQCPTSSTLIDYAATMTCPPSISQSSMTAGASGSSGNFLGGACQSVVMCPGGSGRPTSGGCDVSGGPVTVGQGQASITQRYGGVTLVARVDEMTSAGRNAGLFVDFADQKRHCQQERGGMPFKPKNLVNEKLFLLAGSEYFFELEPTITLVDGSVKNDALVRKSGRMGDCQKEHRDGLTSFYMSLDAQITRQWSRHKLGGAGGGNFTIGCAAGGKAAMNIGHGDYDKIAVVHFVMSDSVAVVRAVRPGSWSAAVGAAGGLSSVLLIALKMCTSPLRHDATRL